MNRLRGQKDFDRVRRAGRAWSHPLLVLNVVQNEQAFSRYGFIAGKSVGNAVARNRAKRLLHEAMRQRHDGIEESWDLVFDTNLKGPFFLATATANAMIEAGTWKVKG